MPIKRLTKGDETTLTKAAKLAQEIAVLFNDDEANKVSQAVYELLGKYSDKKETQAA